MQAVNLREKLNLFSDHWSPKIIGEVNECHVKAVKFKGEFVWHHHEHEDELFLVVKATLRMKFRDHEALVRESEFIIVPRGVEHLSIADDEVHIVLLEPKTTLHTGNITNERTVASSSESDSLPLQQSSHGTSFSHSRRFHHDSLRRQSAGGVHRWRRLHQR